MPAEGVRLDSELSERDERILGFERRWWRRDAAREQAIRTEFGVPPARYHQMLNAVIDSPAAERHDPLLVRRLRRARDARTAARARRSFGTHSIDPAENA